MTQLIGHWPNAAEASDDRPDAHKCGVHHERTPVNVDCVRTSLDNEAVANNESTGAAVARLRLRSGLSVRDLAVAAGYNHGSGVQRYLDPAYDKRLPVEVADRLASALVGKGDPPITRDEVIALTGISFEGRGAEQRATRIDKAPDQPSVRSVDGGETAPVARLDLSYSMGPGRDLDDSYIESEAFEFDLGFLRSMTVTPPDRLRIVDGIGDSMQPTLHDRDLLFVDVNQASLNAQDRIWAIWLFGLGAVKRLRAIDTEKVLVISDNPDVENQIVNRADIIIHGRVVGSIKRH
ncbi:S24 family peptidase [Sphingomonas sp. Xoc002]|uniref:S24 family peptidase n=1 Tax=Sphingomonas sp. Xoc002 TaxID=2837624 RepID=UPI003D16D078